jgi:hypothetical protein
MPRLRHYQACITLKFYCLGSKRVQNAGFFVETRYGLDVCIASLLNKFQVKLEDTSDVEALWTFTPVD